MSTEGVSFVIPVYNGQRHLEEMLRAVLAQACDLPVEVIAVDDGSKDGSGAILERFARDGEAKDRDAKDGDARQRKIRVVAGPGKGAAAALNRGIEQARFPLIAQVDQDVVPQPGWLGRLIRLLENPTVAAAQGHYVAAPGASVWARVTGLDLELRYRRLPRTVDHVCTGNTVYRAAAIRRVGGFAEHLGYAYDNDLSYRLRREGYSLNLCHEARAVHHWPADARGYFRQQYGQGYGRLDLVSRHQNRVGGDDISGLVMMLHGPVVLLATMAFIATPVLAWSGLPWRLSLLAGLGLITAVLLERGFAGLQAFARCGDRAALAFAPVHLLRDLAWAAAIPTWCLRRWMGRPRNPLDSMPR